MENYKAVRGSLGGLISLGLMTILLAVVQMGCTSKSESAKVEITLPVSMNSQKTSTAKVTASQSSAKESASSDGGGTSFNSNINPLSVSDINCFAVFIGGSDLTGNSCTISSSTTATSTIQFGPNVGFVPAGSTISLDATTGQRTIYVVGLHAATTAACSSYANTNPDSLNLSEPFIIATKPTTILGGANSIPITAALDTSKKILDCKFSTSGGAGGGGSGGKPFGDGRDGSFTTSGSGVYPVATSAMTALGARSGSTTVPNTKIVSSSRRITGVVSIGDTAGRLLTTGTTFTANEFSQDDEVVWYVAGGVSSIGMPDDPLNGACGGGLYLGRYGTAHIASVPANNQLLLDQSISGSPGTIRQLSLNNPPSNADYCTIVISRVPNFDSITLAASYTTTLSAQPFSYASGTGGILMIRAGNINIPAGSTLIIDGSNSGYAGGFGSGPSSVQGDGLTRAGAAIAGPNYNGGMPGNTSTLGGAGGGNAGTGGAGGGSGGVGTSSLASCGGPCFPFADRKAFMGGGAGGAGTSSSGGTGGGVVLVYARSITGAGAMNVLAKGYAGASTGVGSGGGAGGTAGLYTQYAPINILAIDASGGGGGTATTGGGGGGGGVVHFLNCPTNLTANISNLVGGGTPGTGGIAGASGVVNSVSDPFICSIP